MIEGRIEEAIGNSLNAAQVRQEFDQYTQGVQRGYPSHEVGLGEYGKLLHKLSGFLHQPDVAFRPDAKQLIEGLFYRHQQTSAVNLEFFDRARESVFDEVLDEGHKRRGEKKWVEEVDLITVLVDQELAEVTRDFNLERQARGEIEALGKQHGEDELDNLLTPDLETAEERIKKVRQAAIESLSFDPQLGQEVGQLRSFQSVVRQMLEAGQSDPDRLIENLRTFQGFLNKDREDSWLDDIYSHALSGHTAQIESILRNVLSRSENPNYIWNKWIESGVIPQALLTSFDEVLTLTHLQEASVALAGMPKEVKARQLLLFLEAGVSAGLIREIVNDKYQLPDELIKDQIDAFIHFYDRVAEKKSSKPIIKPIRGRLIQAALLAALVTAAPYVYSNFVQSETKSAPDEIVQTLSEEELQELNSLYQQHSGDRTPQFPQDYTYLSGPPDQSNLPPDIDQPAGSSERLPLPSNYRFGAESIRPKNDSASEFLAQKRAIFWDLSGKDLWGFYPEMNGQVFDPTTKSWRIDRKISPTQSAKYTFAKDIHISHEVVIGIRTIQLPVKEGHFITKDSFKISGDKTSGQIIQADDGTYFINFASSDIGKTVKVAYDIGKTSWETRPYPTSQDYNDMSRRLFIMQDMPGDVQKFITDLRFRKDINQAVKAKIAEKYIRGTFKYSLNPKWSDWYLQAPTGSKFIGRIFERKRTDCDVANTALIAVLRELGIYAKMAYGFAHNGGSFSDQETNLVQTEYHGWTLAFINGVHKWISLDGTPTSLDEYTKKALEGDLAGAERIEGAESFNRELQNIKKDFEEYQWLVNLLFAEIAALSIYAAARFVNRKNYESGNRLAEEVAQRGVAYWGKASNDIVQYFRNREAHDLRRGGADNTDLKSRFWLIPGITFFSALPLMGDVVGRLRMELKPYNQTGSEVPFGDNASALEFLTKVLGYKAKDMERTLTEQSSKILANQLWGQFESAVLTLTEDGVINHRLLSSLKRLKAPSNPQDWESTKRRVVDDLYQKYYKEKQRILKKQGQTLRPEIEEEIEVEEGDQGDEDRILLNLLTAEPGLSYMSHGEFETKMKQAFRYKLMLWQLGEDPDTLKDRVTGIFQR
ncbi:transglutaminase domain-containing protein [Candidatus Daviesbacteria bacterium]|nr:transglutaminase domain-containing protein [Candidatus Daviesbacteria bacterium]